MHAQVYTLCVVEAMYMYMVNAAKADMRSGGT